MILLIHPPVAKPCEPPLGLARLAGALEANNIHYKLLDANLEGLLLLLDQPVAAEDTWTKRAQNRVTQDLAQIRDRRTYENLDKYKSITGNLNRLLTKVSEKYGCRVTLANYTDRKLMPQESRDLIYAYGHYAENIFYPYYKARLKEITAECNPLFAGISINFLHQALCAFALAGLIRCMLPGVKLIAGGSLVTSWMSNPGWRNPFTGLFDAMICGPGEEPLVSLLTGKMKGQNIEGRSGGNTNGRAAGGVGDESSGGWVDEKANGRTAGGGGNENLYPPSFKALPLNAYLAPGLILPYNTATGCSWNKCSFCPERAENNTYLAYPVDAAQRVLIGLVKETGAALIHLADNCISPLYMRAMIAHPPGAPWYGFARIGKHLADLDFCRQLKQSGCVMLELGLESGNPAVLAALNKGINLDTASRVLYNLAKAGIAAYVYLLFGTPEEDYVKACDTLTFVVKHAQTIRYLNLSIFNMPAAGFQAGQYRTNPFYQADLALYTDFEHPAGWNRIKVRDFLEFEFKKHPLIQPIVRRKPPVFTSNHAALF